MIAVEELTNRDRREKPRFIVCVLVKKQLVCRIGVVKFFPYYVVVYNSSYCAVVSNE